MSLKDQFKDFVSDPAGKLMIGLAVLGLLLLPFIIAGIVSCLEILP